MIRIVAAAALIVGAAAALLYPLYTGAHLNR